MVGNSVPGGVFFKDVKPGNYVVATATEVERRLSFTLTAGQTRYVKTSVSIGILVGRVVPELVDPEVGSLAIQELAYTGGTAFRSRLDYSVRSSQASVTAPERTPRPTL